MPTLIYRNLTDDDMTGMDNLNIAKKKFIRKVRGDRDIIESDVRMKELSKQYETIDKKLLEDNIKGVKTLYQENIKLMLKLKNKFSSSPIGFRTRLVDFDEFEDYGSVPPSPRSIPPASSPRVRLPTPPSSSSPAPAVPSIPPPARVRLPASTGALSPRPPPTSFLGAVGSVFGLGIKRGGKVHIVDTMGVNVDITTLANLIYNNLTILYDALILIISNYQFIKSKDISEILKLDKKFRALFNEDLVPYHPDHIIMMDYSQNVSPYYADIIYELENLYEEYNRLFINNLIPSLENILLSYVK